MQSAIRTELDDSVGDAKQPRLCVVTGWGEDGLADQLKRSPVGIAYLFHFFPGGFSTPAAPTLLEEGVRLSPLMRPRPYPATAMVSMFLNSRGSMVISLKDEGSVGDGPKATEYSQQQGMILLLNRGRYDSSVNLNTCRALLCSPSQ